MSAAREIMRVVSAPGAAQALRGRGGVGSTQPHRLGARLRDEWLPLALWSVGRTGRPGLAGIALLLAAAAFFASTHLQISAEVEALRAGLANTAAQPARAAGKSPTGAAASPRALPGRRDVPAILRRLFAEASREGLAVDIGKYDVRETKGTGLVRYQVSLPVTGPYPQIRQFIDATLAKMPAIALSELSLERKAIGERDVEARLQLTVFTVEAGSPGARFQRSSQRAPPTIAAKAAASVAGAGAQESPQPDDEGLAPASARVEPPTHEAALFAQHSWYVAPPPRKPDPPPQPPPPPEPTAPPLPYAFLGRFSPGGDSPVYVLARGDRVIQARVGDRLDGVYQLESADAAQLVFVYLPLNTRQFLKAGGSR